MTEYFTLNPRYERYELGIAELQRESFFPLYIYEDPSEGNHILGVVFIIGMVVIFGFFGGPLSSDPRQFFIMFGLLAAVLVFLGIVTRVLSTPARRRFERLKKQGVLLEGMIERPYYKLSKSTRRNKYGSIMSITWTRTLNVGYTFVTPSGRRLTGIQSHVIDRHYNHVDELALLNEPVPAKDTPIRVLYLDEQTYIML
jgi:hypothetical protein